MPASRIARSTLCRTSASRLEHREVHVAVARVPAPGDPRAVLVGDRGDRRHDTPGSTARGTTTSTMSSAPFALATQNAFSRASISSAAELRRQHVHVDRAELGEQLGDGGRVLVEPVAVVLLDHHDEVRRASRP